MSARIRLHGLHPVLVPDALAIVAALTLTLLCFMAFEGSMSLHVEVSTSSQGEVRP
jgi:hypothetical protein